MKFWAIVFAMLAWPEIGHAQVINGESTYDDNFVHQPSVAVDGGGQSGRPAPQSSASQPPPAEDGHVTRGPSQ